MISTFFMDIGGVLLTNGWDHTSRQRAARQFGFDVGETNQRHDLTYEAYDRGQLTLEEYLRRTVFFQPRDFSMADFQAFMRQESQPFPEMLRLLAKLKAQYQLKVIAVNNEGRELTEHRIREFHLDALIDGFVSSCFVETRKPDPRMYRLALDMAQVEPCEVVYVEDRDMFVRVGRELGFQVIKHRDYAGTRAALRELGFDAG